MRSNARSFAAIRNIIMAGVLAAALLTAALKPTAALAGEIPIGPGKCDPAVQVCTNSTGTVEDPADEESLTTTIIGLLLSIRLP